MNIQGLVLDDRILWDVDPDNIDAYEHKTFLVSRALTRGNLEDIRAVLRFYTREELKEAVTKSKTLNEKAMHFMAAFLDIKIEAFTCYKLKQSGLNFLPHYGS
jgi:hypothetical protein